ncbi:MAG: transposase domain-containing protein, partial [Lysobacter sp.]|nr:transposase domain-containing protein [Lysobacter sp.]
VCTPEVVEAALAATGRHSKRQRDLPAHAVAYYVIALSLYRARNHESIAPMSPTPSTAPNNRLSGLSSGNAEGP